MACSSVSASSIASVEISVPQESYLSEVTALELNLCEYMHKIHHDARDEFLLPELYSKIDSKNVFQILFMERAKLPTGKLAIDEIEPGYYRGILKGYLCMLETLNLPLDAKLYEQIHDATSEGVFSPEEESLIPMGFRRYEDGMEGFYLIKDFTVSEKGLEELTSRWQTYKYSDEETGDDFYFLKEAMINPRITIKEALDSELPPKITLRPTRPQTAAINVEKCIEMYEKMPKSTEDEKLCAIARLCQDLDQLHVFVDGNIRTTGILLLNRLLIQNGLRPCALKDVNQLDCLSNDEIVALIREGQEFFASI